MTAAADFQQAIRSGRRQGTATLVAHYWCCDEAGDARVGFAVSKSVGNSVVRHRVARRLRHVVLPYAETLPPGSLLVVRATPRAAGATSVALAADVQRALTSLLRRS